MKYYNKRVLKRYFYRYLRVNNSINKLKLIRTGRYEERINSKNVEVKIRTPKFFSYLS